MGACLVRKKRVRVLLIKPVLFDVVQAGPWSRPNNNPPSLRVPVPVPVPAPVPLPLCLYPCPCPTCRCAAMKASTWSMVAIRRRSGCSMRDTSRLRRAVEAKMELRGRAAKGRVTCMIHGSLAMEVNGRQSLGKRGSGREVGERRRAQQAGWYRDGTVCRRVEERVCVGMRGPAAGGGGGGCGGGRGGGRGGWQPLRPARPCAAPERCVVGVGAPGHGAHRPAPVLHHGVLGRAVALRAGGGGGGEEGRVGVGCVVNVGV